MASNAREIGSVQRDLIEEIRARRRQEARYTQQWLADASGIPLPTLGKIERLESSLDVEQLAKIARAFDMTLSEFATQAEEHARQRQAKEDARRRAEQNADLYLADGSLNPARVDSVPLSRSEAEELREDST